MGEPMRTFKLLALVVAAYSAIETASAQQPGDKVVTITERELRTIRNFMGTRESVPRGTILFVKKVEGNQLWVSRLDKAPRAEGWLDRSDVISFSAALNFFNNEIRRNPTAQAYAIRGKIWHEKHEHDKALADWKEAIRRDPNDPLAYVERGSAWFDEKEYDKAIADCNEALRLDPKCGAAYGIRGSAQWAKEEFSKATYDYVDAIRFDRDTSFDSIYRGEVWKDQSEYNKARVNYDLAAGFDDPELGILSLVIHYPLLHRKQDFDEKIAKWTKAIRLHPKNVKAYIVRARFFHRQAEYDKAIADYDEAIRLDPKNPEPWLSEAQIAATCLKARFRDGKKAVHHATKVCELIGWNDYSSLDTLACACAEVGDFPSAVKWEKKALDVLPQEKDVGFRVAYERDFRSRLELFKAHKPFHDEAKK
ncbi:MAG TPA: tetratricopeptide repeat protein [Planctomycetaceae bacterium]|nr:tetratricopeptide repeat protein [Planctomycetaceae bacterium]